MFGDFPHWIIGDTREIRILIRCTTRREELPPIGEREIIVRRNRIGQLRRIFSAVSTLFDFAVHRSALKTDSKIVGNERACFELQTTDFGIRVRRRKTPALQGRLLEVFEI